MGGLSLLNWPRSPRSELTLPRAKGVYALFVAKGANSLDMMPVDASQLLYVGKAGGVSGLSGRCHFSGKTMTHSPRRSLAALLRSPLRLGLRAGSAPHKWGLDAPSEKLLDAWMHRNLEMATLVCDDVDAIEAKLIARYQPPLNLRGCVSNPWRVELSALRSEACRLAHGGAIHG